MPPRKTPAAPARKPVAALPATAKVAGSGGPRRTVTPAAALTSAKTSTPKARARKTLAAPGMPGVPGAPGVQGAPDAPDAPGGPEALLRAGLKALGTVRDDVVKHHTNVIERLLGIQRPEPCVGLQGQPPLGFGALDNFGLRKFEDVFDQRVAAALQRLGLPSAQELQALRDEVQQLRSQLADAEAATRRKR